MIFAGCDVGSLSAEAVIMKDDAIMTSEIIKVRPGPSRSATDVMGAALSKAGLTFDDIDCCISTGYGREEIPFAHDNMSEISCHGKGAHWLVPAVRTVIDVGGQDCKAIRVDQNGGLVNFVMNDKCAAGTGRFLEGIARTLDVGLADLSTLAEHSKETLSFTSICSVFIENEALCYINEGESLADITAGINHSMARRVKNLVARIGITEKVCFTGGVAKNKGVIKSIEAELGFAVVQMPEDPQLIGALGAALFARDKVFEKPITQERGYGPIQRVI
jgi:predicted CoA-substrate-specific enzyme activase